MKISGRIKRMSAGLTSLTLYHDMNKTVLKYGSRYIYIYYNLPSEVTKCRCCVIKESRIKFAKTWWNILSRCVKSECGYI
jgi:hypothetical protein